MDNNINKTNYDFEKARTIFALSNAVFEREEKIKKIQNDLKNIAGYFERMCYIDGLPSADEWQSMAYIADLLYNIFDGIKEKSENNHD